MRLVATIHSEKMIFPLREGSTILGRSKSCRVYIPMKGISRQHAQCYVTGSEVLIRDLESSNGLYVNNQKVKEAQLRDGDVIGLGEFKLVFEAGGDMDATLVEATPIEEKGQSDDGGRGDSEDTDEEPRLQAPSASGEQEEPQSGAKLEYAEDDPDGGENTPVDSLFAPQKYEPKGLAVGPQLIQRDGKWFLQDPVTHREIEIVPKGAEGQAAAPPAEAPAAAPPAKKNLRLALVAGCVLVLVLVALALSGVMKPPPPPPGPVYAPKHYNEAVEQGITYLDEGNMEDAVRTFQRADQKIPDRQVANVLFDVTTMLMARQDATTETDLDRLGDLLRELKRSTNATPKVESFADRKLEWVDKQLFYRAKVDGALKRLRKGDSETALADLQQVPEEDLRRLKAESYVEEARQQCLKKYKNLAKEAELAREWDTAIAHHQKALRFSSQQEEFTKAVENCRQYKLDSSRIAKAKQAMEEHRPDTVESILQEVSPSSPYRIESDSLLSDARQKMQQQETANVAEKVKSLYAAGKGSEAIDLFESKPESIDDALAERIRSVTQVMEMAENDYQKKDYKEAKEGWLLVLQLEVDETNGYNRLAKQRLQEFEQKRRDIALEYEKKAEKALEAAEYQKARELARYAQMVDPEGKLGKGVLEHLDRLGREAWQKGLVAEQKNNIEEARAAYRRVQETAERGSHHYDDARKRLLRLGDNK